MTSTQVEYVGFSAEGPSRVYRLRVRQPGGESSDFTLTIPNEAFRAGRVRYQDAPEICFLRLQRELLASNGALPDLNLRVTDADLELYRAAHAPKPPRRRPTPPKHA
jgi:hypothetical protein